MVAQARSNRLVTMGSGKFSKCTDTVTVSFTTQAKSEIKSLTAKYGPGLKNKKYSLWRTGTPLNIARMGN